MDLTRNICKFRIICKHINTNIFIFKNNWRNKEHEFERARGYMTGRGSKKGRGEKI